MLTTWHRKQIIPILVKAAPLSSPFFKGFGPGPLLYSNQTVEVLQMSTVFRLLPLVSIATVSLLSPAQAAPNLTQRGAQGEVTTELKYTTDGKASVNKVAGGEAKGTAQWQGEFDLTLVFEKQ